MINKNVEEALNVQVQAEFSSAYLYLSMAAYCESISLPGFAHWMRLQHEEETAHALRLFNFVIDRGGHIDLRAIEKPVGSFESPHKMFDEVLAHEQLITEKIHNLYALSVKENDYPTQVEMQWFISEQVEEEKNAGGIVEQLKFVGDSSSALLMLDREMGVRLTEAK